MMIRTMLVATALALAPCAAMADITVITSGGTFPGLRVLSEQWTAQTGKKVALVGGTVTRARDNVRNKAPGDLALLPAPQFDEVRANYKPGTATPIGRVHFGLAQKAGETKPDISTMPKFIAVLKAASGVGFTDPARGSAAGKWVGELLARPEFTGVIPRPIAGTPGLAVARDGIQYGLGPISEEVTVAGVEVVGLLPKEIAMHFDYSGAVLAHAAQPDEAAQFLAFITAPGAQAEWKKVGVEAPVK
jgi:ABC-type molybdate transport system substrate-binding protein